MAEDQTTPEEISETDKEVKRDKQKQSTPSPPPPPPPPPTAHHPIETGIANLTTLQSQAYLQSLEQATANVSHASNPLDVQSGDELLVTLTLASPVEPGEPPYTVDIVYEAVQKNTAKPSGIFLYKQTTVATWTPGLPNNGNLIQQFPLQTIRFSFEQIQNGPADISIYLLNGGKHVGKLGTGKFRIHAEQ